MKGMPNTRLPTGLRPFTPQTGERAEVDWSGPTMHYVDMTTGEIITVYLFVGTLPYSQYSYVEPCLDMKMDTFIRCHTRMYEYFGGVANPDGM